MPTPDKAKEILKAAASVGRLHHAILLYGNSLSPLEDVAEETATALFGRPARTHPDLFELRPEGKARMIRVGSDSDKVAGELPRNTMRHMLSQIRQTSNLGGRKVAIVYEADRMNFVTANAFLKTLEEPPADTTIFMLTTRPNDLLDTIRSRCVALKVDAPASEVGDEEWKSWIEDFSNWQKKLMRERKFKSDEVIMPAYGLLSRFDSILGRLADKSERLAKAQQEGLDDEILEAVRAGERRGVRKVMLAQIEDACVGCALGGEGVPAVKISRAVEALERAAGLMELNMNESCALEYFIISSIRIWTR